MSRLFLASAMAISQSRTTMQFYVGLHQPSDARHFERCMVSVSRLRERVSATLTVGEWMMDSGAFMELKLFGRYQGQQWTPTPRIFAAGRAAGVWWRLWGKITCARPFMLQTARV
jgi:hypothetical protein